MTTKIIGTGSYVPAQIVTNDDLSKIVETNDQWIRSRTGIGERRIATDDSTSDMAAKAAKKAAKPKKEKKPSFFKGLKTEYKKIVFADKETVAKQTVAVVIMSIFIGALIGVLDMVMKFGLSFIL